MKTVVLSFTLTGQNGTSGTTTITIPKTNIPAGNIPRVLIDGVPAPHQSFTQDANNYYVTFSLHFSTHDVQILFAPPTTTTSTTTTSTSTTSTTTPPPPPPPPVDYTPYIVAAIVIVVVAILGVAVFLRRRR